MSATFHNMANHIREPEKTPLLYGLMKSLKIQVLTPAFSNPIYSTRSAATSKALASGVPIDVILKHDNWSQTSTFYRYHRIEIQEQYEEGIDMGTEILKPFQTSNKQCA